MLRDVDGMATVPSGEHCLPGIWAVREGGKALKLASRLEGLLSYYQQCPGSQCEIKLRPMLGQQGHTTARRMGEVEWGPGPETRGRLAGDPRIKDAAKEIPRK